MYISFGLEVLKISILLPNHQRQHRTVHVLKDVLPSTHCARYCAPSQPLLRAFSGWIRSPPPTFRFLHPVAQTLFHIPLTDKICPCLLSAVQWSGKTVVQFELWNRPRTAHFGGRAEGMHLRRDTRNSWFQLYLAGRVLLFSCPRPCTSGGVVEGGRWGAMGRTERVAACLSAAARRRLERRRCISLRKEVMRLWRASFWRRGRP